MHAMGIVVIHMYKLVYMNNTLTDTFDVSRGSFVGGFGFISMIFFFVSDSSEEFTNPLKAFVLRELLHAYVMHSRRSHYRFSALQLYALRGTQ